MSSGMRLSPSLRYTLGVSEISVQTRLSEEDDIFKHTLTFSQTNKSLLMVIAKIYRAEG